MDLDSWRWFCPIFLPTKMVLPRFHFGHVLSMALVVQNSKCPWDQKRLFQVVTTAAPEKMMFAG